jgi:hypothetical protein
LLLCFILAGQKREPNIKFPNIITATAVALLATSATYAAAPTEPKAPLQSHDMPMTESGAQMQMMKDRAAAAKTPAERSKLLSENMDMMKAHMTTMKAKMADGSMMSEGKEPMAMDAAHMEKMKQHMVMMHQMMERLVLQQQLMMPSKK